jgi:hypothetical protein
VPLFIRENYAPYPYLTARTAAPKAQQLQEAKPWEKRPLCLIRDRNIKYATHFSAVGASIKEMETPYRTHEANGVCERFMGGMRREYLDHILIHDDKHLQRVVKEYIAYFNQERPVLATSVIRPYLWSIMPFCFQNFRE